MIPRLLQSSLHLRVRARTGCGTLDASNDWEAESGGLLLLCREYTLMEPVCHILLDVGLLEPGVGLWCAVLELGRCIAQAVVLALHVVKPVRDGMC